MTHAILRPAAGWKVDWVKVGLGGALCTAAFTLSGYAPGLLSALYYSIVGLPLLGLLLVLPSALALGSVAWLLSRILSWRFAVPLACLPFLGWSLVYAPLQQSRILAVAQADGGSLPDFYDSDVLAVLDLTGPRHPSKSHCTATCVEILRSGAIKAIFLPRYISPDGSDVRGVIFRATPYGQRCDRELAPHGVRPLCVRMVPATLWDVTHVLAVRELPGADPEARGLHGGEQLRLTHRYSSDVLLQRTALTARVPSRLPLFGDLDTRTWNVTPRMATTLVNRSWARPPLMTLLYHRVDRRQRGLE
ncbi:MAG: hypothetical protein AAGF78_02105 [Pseudomonadota bacterium]